MDARGRVKVDVSTLKHWLDTHYNVISRDTVSINNEILPLLLSVSMRTNFIVSLGDDIMYNGSDMTDAITHFNMDIKGLKKKKDSIEPESRNKVHHKTDEDK